ncbi:MAG: hypothetical protein ACE15B_18020 [Bryobacteraceae bacterium]
MSVQIQKIDYQGWPNSYRITNGEVEAVVTSDIGPRIMRYGFTGGQNLFKEFPATLGRSGEPEWVIRGGHRIWIAPEDVEKTYAPDNGPVRIQVRGGVLEATQPVEPSTGLEKRIVVTMDAAGAGVQVRHYIRNTRTQPIELAPWALSVMAPGGAGIHGFPPRGTHPEMLAPSNPLVMWAFSDLADPRWTFTKKYLILRQDPANPVPQKLGSFNPETWAAYLLGTELFVKRYSALPGTYPDLGCSFETFTNADFLELETLGPLQTLAQNAELEHIETWTLHRDVRVAAWTDEELDRAVLPLTSAR